MHQLINGLIDYIVCSEGARRLKLFLSLPPQVVGQALIGTLEQGLGDAFTPEVKEAYIAFYSVVTKHMKEGLSDAYRKRD